MICTVAALHHYASLRESTCRRRWLLVTACDTQALSLRHLCHCGNTLSAYTHEMETRLFQMLMTSPFGVLFTVPRAICTRVSTMSCVACGFAKLCTTSAICCKTGIEVII